MRGSAALERCGGLADAPPPRRGALREPSRARRRAGVAALWAAYGAFFSRLSIINHHALNTRTTDLGYYDNIFYQSIHGHPLGCSFIKAGYHGSAHFDPILVLLSPLYLLYPRAELLLGLQSVWLGAGVVPVYLLAQAKLGQPPRRRSPSRPCTRCIRRCTAPTCTSSTRSRCSRRSSLWLLYFLEIGALQALLPDARPGAALPRGRGAPDVLRRRLRDLPAPPAGSRASGWITIVVSLVYFAIVKRFFMTSADIFMSGKDSYSFAYYYEDLIPNHNGVGGLVVSLVTNPIFVLQDDADRAEDPLSDHALPAARVPAVPGAARAGDARSTACSSASWPRAAAVFSVHFQYSSVLLPVAFALTPDGAPARSRTASVARAARPRRARASRGRCSRRRSWRACSSRGSSAASSTTRRFKGGFARVARGLTDKDRETLRLARASRPRRSRVAASVGVTNRLGAHASNRKHAFFYPGERRTPTTCFIDEAELQGADLEKHKKNVGKRSS